MPKTPVIIDCDPGHDDAMALMLALASPELEVVAVTTVAGNQTLDKVTANAIRVLDVVDAHDIPVAAGADRPLVHDTARVADEVHGETGLDGPDLPPASRDPEPIHAVELMARELRKRPLTLIPVGPLTNIALLIAMYPDLVENIQDIVVMGGAIGLGNVTPSAEFNVWCDPEAAKRVFESDADVTMIGLDVTHQAMLSAERAEALRETGHAGAVVADLHAFYRRFHLEVYGHDDTPVHDCSRRRPRDRPQDPPHRSAQRRARRHPGPVPGPHGRRPAPAHGPSRQRARRRRGGRRPLHRPVD